MSLIGGAMNMLGINNESSDKKEGGFLNSLKFWDNKKEEETSQVTNEIKGELNSMFGKILVVAKGLGITTKLDEKTIADGMDKTDDKFYEIFDSSQKDVEGLLTEIGDKIKANPALSSKYGGLLSKLSQIQDGSKIEQTITSLPGGGVLFKLVTGITGKVSRLNGLLGLDKSKLIEETSKSLDELAVDLSNQDIKQEDKEVVILKDIVSPMKDPIVTSDMNDKRSHGNHNAWDITTLGNDISVNAVVAGEVIKVGQSSEEGNFVIIKHIIDGVEHTTSYAHFDKAPNVIEGQFVETGQYLADMGGLGAHSTGPHLHFKVRKNGEIIDPGELLDPTEFKFKEHGKIVAFNQSEHASEYKNVA